jgi:mannose-1-phosphate guanylyltransferase
VTLQAVILAGGKGTRMWPLTAGRPKALLPVAGMPFLEMQLSWLSSAGVTEVLIAVGEEQEEVWRGYLADRGETGGPRVEIMAERDPLDTAGALVAVRDRLADRFLALNGDVILDVDPELLLAPGGHDQWRARLMLTVVDDASAYGSVMLEGSKVTAFVEKADAPGDAGATVNAGLYLMERSVLDALPPGRLSLERDVFPRLATDGELTAVVGEGAWIDIGTAQRYIEAHEIVARGRTKLHDSRGRDGELVTSGAGSWAWVGPGTTIDPTARLNRAVVLDGATIGARAEVCDAVVGWGTQVKDRAVVAEHSLVGEGSVIGAGCELRHGVRIAPGIDLDTRAVTFTAPT